VDAKRLIALFENVNKYLQGKRKGVATTDASPLPFGSYDVTGEFSELCEGTQANRVH